MKTGLITFNVKDRGRKHRGVERNFDTASLAAVVNGPAVQERVANRDLPGYLGHWPRVMFGMDPGEGGPDPKSGKVVRLEPSHVTTMLRAMPDGTIEHEAEFLDTPPGRTAKRLFGSRRGGFSSAIAADPIRSRMAGVDIVSGFYGFDYVSEPNFATNRGFALDSAEGEEQGSEVAMFDAVAEDSADTLRMLDGLYTDLQAQFDRLAEHAARQQRDMDVLLAILAERPQGTQDRAREVLARLDAAFERPEFIRAPVGGGLTKMAEDFRDATLVGFEPRPEDAGTKAERRNMRAMFDGVQRLLRR